MAELGSAMAGDASGSHLTPDERRKREEAVLAELEAGMDEGEKQAAKDKFL